MFFKKKESIKLEMYAPIGHLIEMFPPVFMKHFVPDWWNAINPKNDVHEKNLKGKSIKFCPGFKDLYSVGIGIPLWSDYEINISDEKIVNVQWPTDSQQIGAESHNLTSQTPGAWPGYGSVKFTNPWKFYCEEDIKFAWVQPVWNQTDPIQFITVPGISEFNVNRHTSINTLWKLGHRKEFLKAGTIMAQLVPLTERPIELVYKVMTSDDFKDKFAIWDFSLKAATYARNKVLMRKNNLFVESDRT